MLGVCLPQQHGLPFYHTNTKLDTCCVFSQTGLPRQVNTWPHYKCLSQACNDALLSPGTEPSVDNLVVANLRSYLLVQWFSTYCGVWAPL